MKTSPVRDFRMLLGLGVCALACAAQAEETLAPADDAVFADEFKGRGDRAADVPTAPAKYRRPADWKPTPPCPKTLPEIARDHSTATLARARAQMEKVNAVNRAGKYAATGAGMDRHACPDWFVDAKLGMFVDWDIVPQTTEFIDKYDPDLLWYDADWSSRATENGSYDITAYFYNRAEGRKEVCCNDRYGRLDPAEEAAFRRKGIKLIGCRTVRGDFFTDEWGDTEENIDPAAWHPWESCSGISKAYGNHWMEELDPSMVMTDREFICHFTSIVARGGNLLLLVNLDGQGAIPKVQDGTRRIHRVRRDGRACRDPRARLLWWNQIMGVGFIWFFWYLIAPAMNYCESAA